MIFLKLRFNISLRYILEMDEFLSTFSFEFIVNVKHKDIFSLLYIPPLFHLSN